MDEEDISLILSATALVDPTTLSTTAKAVLEVWGQGRLRKAEKLADELSGSGTAGADKIEEFRKVSTQHPETVHIIVQRYFEDDEEEKSEYYACLIEGIADGSIEEQEHVRYLKLLRQLTCRKIEVIIELINQLDDAYSQEVRDGTDQLDVVRKFFDEDDASDFQVRLREELKRKGFWREEFRARQAGWPQEVGAPNDDFKKLALILAGKEIDDWG